MNGILVLQMALKILQNDDRRQVEELEEKYRKLAEDYNAASQHRGYMFQEMIISGLRSQGIPEPEKALVRFLHEREEITCAQATRDGFRQGFDRAIKVLSTLLEDHERYFRRR